MSNRPHGPRADDRTAAPVTRAERLQLADERVAHAEAQLRAHPGVVLYAAALVGRRDERDQIADTGASA